jgi:ABC-type transporter Mla MlaB component
MNGSTDNMHIEVVDSGEAALLLHVTREGKVRMTNTMPDEKVPALLRQLADLFEVEKGLAK